MSARHETRVARAWTRSRRLRLFLVLLLVATSAVVLRRPILRAVHSWLVVDDELVASDVLYVLNANASIRPLYAATLFRLRLAPRVVLPGTETDPAVSLGLFPRWTDVARAVLVRQGVPDSVITTLPTAVTSTWEEALVLRDYIRDTGVRRVIVVTTTTHTRRSRWLFRRATRGLEVQLQFAGVPNPGYDANSWWRSEAGLIAVTNEYLKLLHNALTHRAPGPEMEPAPE